MPTHPRPRPFNENLTKLEDKFEGIVTMAKLSMPFNKHTMADTVRMAQLAGTVILTQKRRKRTLPRLPSEVWEFMLMEFGGDIGQQQHIPIMFLSAFTPPLVFSPLVIWDIYTTEMANYEKRVQEAEDCRDCMKRFMHII
jgi:hypothetical protein